MQATITVGMIMSTTIPIVLALALLPDPVCVDLYINIQYQSLKYIFQRLNILKVHLFISRLKIYLSFKYVI